MDRKSITYEIKEDLKQHVWEFTKDNNIGNRGHFDGDRERQFVGLIGEFIVSCFMGLAKVKYDYHQGAWKWLPELSNDGFDGGFDIELVTGEKFDVKTMTRNVDLQDHHEHNVVASQVKYNCDFYIFCSLNKRKNTLSIDGYLSKFELIALSNFHPSGEMIVRDNGTTFLITADTFSVEAKHLHDPGVLENLGGNLLALSKLEEQKGKYLKK
jgi:hypothetical protein